jgi:hypothetical protein
VAENGTVDQVDSGEKTRSASLAIQSKILSDSNHDKWRTRRRLITPSFHDTRLLNSFVDIFNRQSRVLAERLARLSMCRERPHNIYPYISACTLDIIAGLVASSTLVVVRLLSSFVLVEAATGTHPRAQHDDNENAFVQATVR